jgi:DNA repair protein RecN (Recombination protein N)
VSLSLLRDIGDQLVDIHGQGEHLSLLKPRSHMPLLDGYAGLDQERKAVALLVQQLQTIRRELRQLRQDERKLAQRLDLLRYQVEDIEAAKLRPGEEDELRIERVRVTNVERLMGAGTLALKVLNGLDDDSLSVNDLLGQAERQVEQLARLDPAQKDLFERLQGLSYQLTDLTGELADYIESLEFEPRRLDYLEERIELINQLKRKYGENIEAILAYQERAAAELDNIAQSEERIEQLSVEEERLLHQIGEKGLVLSEKRREAAQKLSAAVEQELSDLHMERAQFEVSIKQVAIEDGAFVGNERLAFDVTGIDQIEFLVSANPGESPRPLIKVASGGETSRLMLALKTVLARVDATPTLIFDEIDQGIGGRVGDVVGRKLWGLTNPADHQVIVVTHLPQLAGYADRHYHVSKQLANNRTTTTMTVLDEGGRIDELAAMLGTQDVHATGGAQSILRNVSQVKIGSKNWPATGSQ